MKLYLLGLYTARLELFKFFFVLVSGLLIYSVYLLYRYSGSVTRKKKRQTAMILMIIYGTILLAMGISWLLSQTNYGWWFDRL